MNEAMVVFLLRRMLITGLVVVSPMLVTAMAVGLIISILQAVTSIRDMTLTIIPKILTLLGVLLWLLPWMLNVIVSYTYETLEWVKYFRS